MTRVLPAGALAYALATAIAVLGGAIAAVLWRGTDAMALLQTPARPMIDPPLPSSTPDLAGFPEIRNRALFYASRSFFVEAAQPADVQLPPPAYTVEGTLLIPGKPAAAFLKHQPDGVTKTVHPGDALDGWKVGAVKPSGVILADGTHRIEITSKGLASVASFRPSPMPVAKARHARKQPLILGARYAPKSAPIWTGNEDALPKPAVRLYRPPH